MILFNSPTLYQSLQIVLRNQKGYDIEKSVNESVDFHFLFFSVKRPYVTRLRDLLNTSESSAVKVVRLIHATSIRDEMFVCRHDSMQVDLKFLSLAAQIED